MKEAEKVAKLCVCGKVALNISCFSLSPKMDDKNEVDNARAVAAFFYFFWYHTHTHSILLREWKEIHISDYLKNRPTRKKKSVVFITLVVTRHTITFLFLNYKKKIKQSRADSGERRSTWVSPSIHPVYLVYHPHHHPCVEPIDCTEKMTLTRGCVC